MKVNCRSCMFGRNEMLEKEREILHNVQEKNKYLQTRLKHK